MFHFKTVYDYEGNNNRKKLHQLLGRNPPVKLLVKEKFRGLLRDGHYEWDTGEVDLTPEQMIELTKLCAIMIINKDGELHLRLDNHRWSFKTH